MRFGETAGGPPAQTGMPSAAAEGLNGSLPRNGSRCRTIRRIHLVIRCRDTPISMRAPGPGPKTVVLCGHRHPGRAAASCVKMQFDIGKAPKGKT